MSLSGNDNIAPVTFDEFRAIVDNNAKRYSLPIPEVVSDIAAELGVPADSPAMNILRKKLNQNRSLDSDVLKLIYDKLLSGCKSASHAPLKKPATTTAQIHLRHGKTSLHRPIREGRGEMLPFRVPMSRHYVSSAGLRSSYSTSLACVRREWVMSHS